MKKRHLVIAVIVAGVAVVTTPWAYLAWWAGQPLPLDNDTVFVVEPEMRFSEVSDQLVEAGIVSGRRLSLRAWQRGLLESLKRGEYRITTGMTADGLLDRLTRGDVVAHRFLIVEGSTVGELLRRLAADDRLDHDLEGIAEEHLMAHLGLAAGSPEGWFFPDTYQFTRGDKTSGLLLRAEREMQRTLKAAWAQRAPDLPLETPYAALILASIIEKETALAADRPRVSGVFARRLVLGMRLQSDPTVIYGLGRAFDGNLTRRMLKEDGPYNTYRRDGLPPTPIALPGSAAIDAALNPQDGKALYFVSRGDGTSQFSETLDEHNAAVARYQRR